jgi:hypothetical protein
MLVRPDTHTDDHRAARILARSFYSQLRASGYSPRQLVGLASELIALIANEIRQQDASPVLEGRDPPGLAAELLE